MSRQNSGSETMIMDRDQVIIRTSIVGILANVFLAAFKAAVGIASHSIAVVLDAVNNLSDALSSIITIIGTKLAGKQTDKKHPFGHGRVEYLSAMIVSGIVLYAGITSAVESVKKIIHPEKPDYSMLSLVIIAVAVAVKIILGRYVRAKGEQVNSGSLVASGSDAMFDAILSASVLASAIIFMVTGISLEAWVGVFISVIIIKSGIEMMMETLNEILGARADKETTDQIKQLLTEDPKVHGAYDLILHNYGPDAYNGSIHIEVPDTLSAGELDVLTREITAEVYRKHKVILTAISVYSVNTKDPGITKMRAEIGKTALDQEYVMQMHGFYVDQEARIIRFDLVISFDAPDRAAVCAAVYEKLKKQYPDYQIQITPDVDFS